MLEGLDWNTETGIFMILFRPQIEYLCNGVLSQPDQRHAFAQNWLQILQLLVRFYGSEVWDYVVAVDWERTVLENLTQFLHYPSSVDAVRAHHEEIWLMFFYEILVLFQFTFKRDSSSL
jgi:hypothetical protein